MAAVALKSSVLKSTDYDVATKVLTLEFHSGKTYRYAEVPLRIYQGLVLADSAGKYFSAHIRGKYKAPEE